MSVSSNRLKEPNILLASANCQRLLRNVQHVLDAEAIQALQTDIDRNVVALFRLGEGHLDFAKNTSAIHWRQKISRLYYGAYNVRRAVALRFEGHFATDVTDHKSIGDLPDAFSNANTFSTQLQTLRDDRNLADYNHLADVVDLIIPPKAAEAVVIQFRDAAHLYLTARGVPL